MKIEFITIGDEILSGDTVNTNAAYIGEKFIQAGFQIKWISTIGDNVEDIVCAVRNAKKRADVIITSGGLGPTNDDRTRDAICRLLNVEFEINLEVLENIKSRFNKRGLDMSEVNKVQALLPQGCEILKNEKGTAPGLLFKEGSASVIVLPGVPHEFEYFVEKRVIPFLESKGKKKHILTRTIRTTGISESSLFEKIENSKILSENVKISFLPRSPGVDIKVISKDSNYDRARASVQNIEKEIIKQFEKNIFGFDDEKLEEVVGRMLKDLKLTLTVAESCTGGLISHRITNIPGSSQYFDRGIIAYSNKAKIQILKVEKEFLKENGAVSEGVALAMAEGARKISNSDIGLSTTGIAGPEGGTKNKPVGLVYIGISTKEENLIKKFRSIGDREKNKIYFAQESLDFLRVYLKDL